MTLGFLPYGRQLIEDDDQAAVARALEGAYLTTGPVVEAFEAALCRLTGARHAVACSSGTAALHLTALALGLGPGDAAVVPAVTFAGTANAVRHTGAEVVFADVDGRTGLMTEETLAEALSATDGRRVAAVYPVHLAGQCVDMEAVGGLARTAQLAVVEDAAHAIGTQVDGDGRWVAVGACRQSDMTIFSFHPVKTVTTGEGGAVTANDDGLADRARLLRNHGIVRDPAGFTVRERAFGPDGEPNPWYYEIAEIGFNYRLTDVQCALGLSQLAKLDRFVARRRHLVARYRDLLGRLRPLVEPLAALPRCRPAWHLSVALVDFAAAGIDRATVMRRLAERGIGSQVHYMPLPLHPCYRDRCGDRRFPGAEAFYARALSLPLFPAMADADVDRVVAALAEILGIRR